MSRRNQLIATTALAVACSLPTSAALAQQDLRMPDTRDAAAASEVHGATEPSQDLRSPDATDAAQHRGLYEAEKRPYALNRDYGSPDAADVARDLPSYSTLAPVVTEARSPSGGFDWGDAGMGAAGMLALFSIATGSALLLTSRRRRRHVRIATH